MYFCKCNISRKEFRSRKARWSRSHAAIEYFEKGCENANGESCRDLGERYLWGLYGVTQDVGRAALLSEGCKNDDNDACKTLEIPNVFKIESDSKELKSVIRVISPTLTICLCN